MITHVLCLDLFSLTFRMKISKFWSATLEKKIGKLLLVFYQYVLVHADIVQE